jgi:hypothetical protein
MDDQEKRTWRDALRDRFMTPRALFAYLALIVLTVLMLVDVITQAQWLQGLLALMGFGF